MTKAFLLPVLLLAAATATQAKRLTFDLSDTSGPVVLKQEDRLPIRSLQDNVDCKFQPPNLVCTSQFPITDTNNEPIVTVQFQTLCDMDSQVGFDFRIATGCQCAAKVIRHDGTPSKQCPCTVCDKEFGDQSVSIDCSLFEDDYLSGSNATEIATGPITDTSDVPDSVTLDSSTAGSAVTSNEENRTDPFVFDTCTSIDCTGACNGTCALNCAQADESCLFCSNNPANSVAPTPAGNIEKSTSGSIRTTAWVAALSVAALCL